MSSDAPMKAMRAPKLTNAASQAVQRYAATFAARNWDALAKVLADDVSVDDRRRVVNAGIRRGRDAEISSAQATTSSLAQGDATAAASDVDVG